MLIIFKEKQFFPLDGKNENYYAKLMMNLVIQHFIIYFSFKFKKNHEVLTTYPKLVPSWFIYDWNIFTI